MRSLVALRDDGPNMDAALHKARDAFHLAGCSWSDRENRHDMSVRILYMEELYFSVYRRISNIQITFISDSGLCVVKARQVNLLQLGCNMCRWVQHVQ